MSAGESEDDPDRRRRKQAETLVHRFVPWEALLGIAVVDERGEVRPGRMLVYETGWLNPPGYIINFPTKRDWRSPSRLEDIEAGLSALAEEIRTREIRSVAIPPLGCGNGGLDWAEYGLASSRRWPLWATWTSSSMSPEARRIPAPCPIAAGSPG